MKNKAYLYPLTGRLKTGIYNPYLDNFIGATRGRFEFINESKPSFSGIFDFLKYIHKTDYLFLNWIENVPDKKFGFIQAILVLLMLRFKKLLGIKVIWTLHNKFSHTSQNLKIKKKLFNQLLKRSDFIITHASEGVDFAEKKYPGIKRKIFYFQHPVVPKSPNNSHPKVYDFLIWGSITPYKGVDKFLEWMQKEKHFDSYKIVVAGKCISDDFYLKIKKFEGPNCAIINDFINEEDLRYYIEQTRVVLFTYSSPSVLSSGALIDSIAYRAIVAGPSVGAFLDLSKLGVIKTYNDFDELIHIFEELIITGSSINENIETFVRDHTWDKFAEQFISFVDERE